MAYSIQDRNTLMMTPLQRKDLTEACERGLDGGSEDEAAPGGQQFARGTQRMYAEVPREQRAADVVLCIRPGVLVSMVAACAALSAIVGVLVGAAL